MKTAKQVQGDVIALLKNSALTSMITGKVYRNGYRPKDSKAEDAIVTFTAGQAEQVQTGIVTINIFIPDIDPFANGVMVENGARSEQLEIAASAWVESLTAGRSDYRFKLQQTITTAPAPEINQHFIVIKLQYKLLTN